MFVKKKKWTEREYLLAHFRECASLFCVSYSFLQLKNFYNYYKRSLKFLFRFLIFFRLFIITKNQPLINRIISFDEYINIKSQIRINGWFHLMHFTRSILREVLFLFLTKCNTFEVVCKLLYFSSLCVFMSFSCIFLHFCWF